MKHTDTTPQSNFHKKKYLLFGILALFFTLLIATNLNQSFDWRSSAKSRKQETRTTQKTQNKLETLKEKLLKANNTLKKQRGAKRKAEPGVLALAQQRKKLLFEEANNNPKKVFSYLFSESEFSQLDPVLQNSGLIEKPAHLEGTVTTYFFDDFDNQKFTEKKYLRPQQTPTYKTTPESSIPVQLVVSENNEHLQDGASIAVDGYEMDSSLMFVEAVSEGSGAQPNQQAVISDPYRTTGSFSFLVIPINFVNNRRQPYSPSELYNAFFSGPYSTSTAIKEMSYGKTTVTGEVLDWIELSDTGEYCNFYIWANEAMAIAQANGVDLEKYDRLVFFWPRANVDSCGWTGIAGSAGDIYMTQTLNNELPIKTLTHEFGHTIGLSHAQFIGCYPNAIDTYANCSVQEYGDNFDAMGLQHNHFNAAKKEQLGWLNVFDQSELNMPTLVYLRSLEPPEAVAYKILKTDTLQYYYFEKREPYGIDIDIPEGVYVRISDEQHTSINGLAGSFLLDTHPQTTVGRDQMMLPGDSFTDEVNHLKVTVLDDSDNDPKTQHMRLERILPDSYQGDKLGLKFGSNGFVELWDEDAQLALGQNFTFEGWVKIPNTGSSKTVTYLSRYSVTNKPAYRLVSWVDSTKNTADLRFAVPGLYFISPSVLPLDEWVHIAVTKEGNTLTGYLDGQVIAQAAGTVTSVDESEKFYTQIGARRAHNNLGTITTTWDYLEGSFDDVRISNSARDISTNWANGVYNTNLSTDANTIGLWKFDNSVNDSSNNKIDTYPVGDFTYVEGVVSAQTQVCPSPQLGRSHYYGYAYINGQPAPLGTDIKIYSIRNDLVGCGSVDLANGGYRFIIAWEENPDFNGARSGEQLIFKVNGIRATTTPAEVVWNGGFNNVTLNITQ